MQAGGDLGRSPVTAPAKSWSGGPTMLLRALQSQGLKSPKYGNGPTSLGPSPTPELSSIGKGLSLSPPSAFPLSACAASPPSTRQSYEESCCISSIPSCWCWRCCWMAPATEPSLLLAEPAHPIASPHKERSPAPVSPFVSSLMSFFY